MKKQIANKQKPFFENFSNPNADKFFNETWHNLYSKDYQQVLKLYGGLKNILKSEEEKRQFEQEIIRTPSTGSKVNPEKSKVLNDFKILVLPVPPQSAVSILNAIWETSLNKHFLYSGLSLFKDSIHISFYLQGEKDIQCIKRFKDATGFDFSKKTGDHTLLITPHRKFTIINKKALPLKLTDDFAVRLGRIITLTKK